MPITYVRDDARRLITVAVDGPLVLAEVLATIDRQAAEGTWHYARLYDDRRLRPVPTSAEVRTLLDGVRGRIREHGSRGPVAILTDQPAVFGMVRMYMSLAGDEPAMSVFRDIGDAERWLGERGHGG
jgi:hypothetical protein